MHLQIFFFLSLPFLILSTPTPYGPRRSPKPFDTTARPGFLDWNRLRPDSFLKKRDLHSVEHFTNPPPIKRRRSPETSPSTSLLAPLEDRATPGQWSNMGGLGSYHPSAISWGPGRQDIFYTHRNDRRCYHRFYANGGWSQDWADLNGSCDFAPSGCKRRPNYMHVFCKGTDGQCWHRPYNGGSWGGWQGLGGSVRYYPCSCSWGFRHVGIYVCSPDRQLWGRQYDENTGWGNWANMGGSLAGAPTGVSWGEGNTMMVVMGDDGQAWTTMTNNGAATWTNWQSMGGSLDAPPAAVAVNGTMSMFVTGTDGAVWTRTFTNSTGSWSGWMNMGGTVMDATPPDVTATDSRNMEVYYTSTGGAVYRKKMTGGTWSSSWENMGGSVASKPSSVGWGPGNIDVYGIATDGSTRRCY
ncbi:hypothetical protein QBC38DRAFT_361445 [Podospora fimiseda]|uniref:PLL-like beta propeller domain-containing protein n=1 Tax=Podospora fimiseda TaxID=252190 RepID=A0AAN7BSH9_9PEZI|nr:hypothetical protein QBC38DRAFT_361445 [Podospora fimiseda]